MRQIIGIHARYVLSLARFETMVKCHYDTLMSLAYQMETPILCCPLLKQRPGPVFHPL